MGARMRAVDGRRPCWAPWSSGRSRCEVACVSCWAPGIRCSFPGGPDYTKLYNDAYGVVVGTKHPGALGRSCREVLAEAWDFIGPRFDTVFTEGQPISTLTHQLFTFHRKVGFPFVCRDTSASGQLYLDWCARWALVSITDQWESDIKVADGFR